MPAVGGMEHIVEVLAAGDDAALTDTNAELRADGVQHIDHRQLMPPTDGSQAILQVPVVGKNAEQHHNGGLIGG